MYRKVKEEGANTENGKDKKVIGKDDTIRPVGGQIGNMACGTVPVSVHKGA